MPTTDKQRLLSALLGSDPTEWLRAERARGASWREISLTLRDCHDFDCTPQWLWQHYRHIDAEAVA